MKLITIILLILLILDIILIAIAGYMFWKMKKDNQVPDYYDSERPYIDKR